MAASPAIRPIRQERSRSDGGNARFLRSMPGERKATDGPDMPDVPVVARDEFVEDFADEYTPSHATFIGPTRRGKTTLCFQLLDAVLKRHKKDRWSVLILHGKIKKRDKTIPEWAKKSNYRVVSHWPPGFTLRPKHWKRNVNGYVLRPINKKLTAKEEEKLLGVEFVKGIRTNYHSTRNVKITVVDERAQADKDLKLTTDLDAPLQRGLPHNPEWNNIQRGKWISYHCYDAPEHMFIFSDDDDSNLDRYAEFGCGDSRVIKKLLSSLETRKVEGPDGGMISQCLYMRRSDRFMCIVDT